MCYIINIGFIDFRIIDLLDILIVAWLIFQIYKLLRGSIAFNIFVGMVTLYAIWQLVLLLKMELLSMLLGQFVSVGVILVAVVFQPEIRRFLLYLGNTTLKSRVDFVQRLFGIPESAPLTITPVGTELKNALLELSEQRIGALVVLAPKPDLVWEYIQTGTLLKSEISKSLLMTIFAKDTPLHDGAVVISEEKIYAASCILPVSESRNLPENAGLRHRAGLGISEAANVLALIVSEENGRISYSYHGQLSCDIEPDMLEQVIKEHLKK